ncbi:S8 family serine peptidase [Candidatus Fermentibacteria bacterium]|nr:S8 family serine peptidase [Candidatus Fermentibacteria bacterium]
MRWRLFFVCLVLPMCVTSAVSAPLSAEAMRKLDPRLVLLAHDPVGQTPLLGSSIAIHGTGAHDVVVPLVVKTNASRAALESVGAAVGTRLGDIVTLRLSLDRLEDLALLPQVEAVEASYWLDNALDVSTVECGGAAVHGGSPPYTGAGVIVGLLDSGIDPVHDDFEVAPNNSRVLSIWDQYGSGSPPSGYTYGTEWTKAQIDAGACTMTDPGAHGSHCAGIAAGDGSSSASGYVGMAPDANIIMVANRSDDMFNYGGREGWTATTAYSLDGLNYLHGKATSLAMPLVVSWSQSVTMGPHDGTTLFEQGVDNFVSATDVAVVVAAGNWQTSNLHGSGTVGVGTPVTVSFNVSSANASLPFEIWYALGDQFTFEVLPPGEAAWYGPYGPTTGGWVTPTNAHGDQMWIWGNPDHSVSHTGYFQIYVQNSSLGVQQGAWQFRLAAANALPQGGFFDVWFERNRPVALTSHIDLSNNIGMPGTAQNVITVGSYCTKDPWQSINGNWYSYGETPGQISGFSSNGPTADGRQKPELSAPGGVIASVLSSGAAGSYNPVFIATDGVHVHMQGTSMSTPHVAGAAALLLESNPALTAAQIKILLTTTARDAGAAGWDPAYGWGKLDAAAAMAAVPVELASFSGEGAPGAAVLRWSTASESENLGFYLLRAVSADDVFVRVNSELIPGAGTTQSPREYSYRDEPLASARYYYTLVDVASDGRTTTHGPIQVDVMQALPAALSVAVEHGDPVIFRIAVMRREPLRLAMYDLAGHQVFVRDMGELDPGSHVLSWDGCRDEGSPVSSGTYFYRVSSGSDAASGKAVFLR